MRRAEQAQKEAEEAERQRVEREHIENTTGGVDYSEHFRAVALSRPEWKDGDRITLPVSALETLQALFFSFSFFSLFLFFWEKKNGRTVIGSHCLCPLSKLCRHGACWGLVLRV